MQGLGHMVCALLDMLGESWYMFSTWRCAESLLGSRVADVDAPGIAKERDSAQRADCVHQEQGSVLMTQLAHACQALLHSCAALTLHNNLLSQSRTNSGAQV